MGKCFTFYQDNAQGKPLKETAFSPVCIGGESLEYSSPILILQPLQRVHSTDNTNKTPDSIAELKDLHQALFQVKLLIY